MLMMNIVKNTDLSGHTSESVEIWEFTEVSVTGCQVALEASHENRDVLNFQFIVRSRLNRAANDLWRRPEPVTSGNSHHPCNKDTRNKLNFSQHFGGNIGKSIAILWDLRKRSLEDSTRVSVEIIVSIFRREKTVYIKRYPRQNCNQQDQMCQFELQSSHVVISAWGPDIMSYVLRGFSRYHQEDAGIVCIKYYVTVSSFFIPSK
jgi:hypothetical protein